MALTLGSRSSSLTPLPLTPSPSPTGRGERVHATMALGPTAAAVATLLPPPTPIPTAGSLSDQPSAPVRIVIPAIGVDAPVVEIGWHVEWRAGEARGVWETVAGAVGHHRGSADPGESGNCVLSAHSSEAGGALFRRLNELSVGDVVQLYNSAEICYTYYVTTVLIVDETGATAVEKREHAAWLDPTDESVLTLLTCWPDWAYTHRVIVRATLHAP